MPTRLQIVYLSIYPEANPIVSVFRPPPRLRLLHLSLLTLNNDWIPSKCGPYDNQVLLVLDLKLAIVCGLVVSIAGLIIGTYVKV